MKTKCSQVSLVTILLVLFLGLAGCENNSESKSAGVDSSTTTPPAQPVASALDPRYEATLADGIDFTKPGYPNFIAEVSGMSGWENWGRWTDADAGPAARFRFKQPLPQKFTVEIIANAFGPNEDHPSKVRIGSVEKTFVVPTGIKNRTYSLAFEAINGADVLEIVPPKPMSPAELKVSGDPRRIGLALISLKIRQ